MKTRRRGELSRSVNMPNGPLHVSSSPTAMPLPLPSRPEKRPPS
jgi:hypothetical protein